ncbi:MAG: hypothetical protein MZV64_04325 [Ignavibacteriales bacterium]|nr:hypothetical protein [Ignavibacteriales bacterium]
MLKLDLNKYGSEVCFAIAQIGECKESIDFLWKYLHSSPLPDQFPKIFFAIGKIGNDNDLKILLEFYNSFDGPIFPYEGISEAILQFHLRGIKSDVTRSILETEITNQLTTESRIELALFTQARNGSSSLTDDQLQNIFQLRFTDNSGLSDDTELKQYLLMTIIRSWKADKVNLFIDSGPELRKTLLEHWFRKSFTLFQLFYETLSRGKLKGLYCFTKRCESKCCNSNCNL